MEVTLSSQPHRQQCVAVGDSLPNLLQGRWENKEKITTQVSGNLGWQLSGEDAEV